MANSNQRKRVVVAGGLRIPFTKSFGSYGDVSNQDMMTFVIQQIVEKYNLEGKILGDVALGAIMKHSSDWNLARECVLGTSLSPRTPGYDLQRACGTGLEAINQLALKIGAGQIDVGIGGGTDTNSDAPIALNRAFGKKLIKFGRASKTTMDKIKAWKGLRLKDLKPNFPEVVEPRTLLSMGQHTEKMAQEWKITREDQDKLALASHQTGVKAYDDGFYDDLVVPYQGLNKDSILRADTTIERLAKLKPAFDFTGKGTLTAGNSSPLSDGAAATLVCSEEYAEKNNLPVLAYFVDAQAAAVDFVHGEGLLMAPTYAVSEMLTRNNLALQDFDIYEIHEAFAAQVLCTLRAWESVDFCRERLNRPEPLGSIDRSKMNIKGGSVALGHPFAATGARIVATLAKMLNEAGSKKRGLISICTAGGMGVAAILESP